MRKQTKIWKTKTGDKIRICDMEDSHLLNTIRMLERVAKQVEIQKEREGYQILSCLQGEMAILSVENELERLDQEGIDPSEINPLYDNLVNESIRRGLK